jgi:hypothetical protein
MLKPPILLANRRRRVVERNENYLRKRCCGMRERSKATIENRTRPGRLPCERFRPNEPERYRLGTFGLSNQALAFEVKNPLYFCCCLQGGLFCYPLRLHGRARPQKAGPSKSGRFWRNEPNQIWRSQRAGGTSLSRDSARMVISAIVEGLCHNHFRHFPQTKPISANEANVEKPNEPMLQDEQHRTRLIDSNQGNAVLAI